MILKSGTNKIDDKLKSDSLFAGHLKNIRRLANLGKLVVAGPFGKQLKELQGIVYFKCKDNPGSGIFIRHRSCN